MSFSEKIKKVPCGVISALAGIFAFYDTLAIILLYVIFSAVKAQTTQTATLFDSWYQTLMFIFDIALVTVFVLGLVGYIIKKRNTWEKDKRGK